MSLVWILNLNSKLRSFTLQVLRILNSMNYSLDLHFSLKLHGAGVQINISNHGFCDPGSTLKKLHWLHEGLKISVSSFSSLRALTLDKCLGCKNETCSGESTWVAIHLHSLG